MRAPAVRLATIVVALSVVTISQPARATAAMTPGPIALGVLTDDSGPSAGAGVPRTTATRLFFSGLNADGGVHGREVALTVRDHQSDPALARRHYEEIRHDVLMIQRLQGTPILRELMPLIREDRMPASPGARVSSLASEASLIMSGASYRSEMLNAVEYVATFLRAPPGTRIAAVVQDDEFGWDGMAGVDEGAARHGFEIAAAVSYAPGATDYTPQIAALRRSGAEYVFLAVTTRATGALVGGSVKEGFTPTFFGSAHALEPALFDADPSLRSAFEGRWFTSSPFAYWGEPVPGMDAMIRAVRRSAPKQPPNTFFVQGWLQARLVAEVLDRAADRGDLSRRGMLRALDTITDEDFDGLCAPLTYTESHRIPTARTRVLQLVFDDARYPGLLKPVSGYYSARTRRPAAP